MHVLTYQAQREHKTNIGITALEVL